MQSVPQLRKPVEHIHGFARRFLLALFLGEAPASPQLPALHHHDGKEVRGFGRGPLQGLCGEIDLVLALLTPFQKHALEVLLLLRRGLHLDIALFDEPADEPCGAPVALIQIYRAHQRLESVAADIAVVGFGKPCIAHEAIQPYLGGEGVQRAAPHQFAACRGEKALMGIGEAVVYDVAHYRLDDGIPQELQPLVIDQLPAVVARAEASVAQRQPVQPDMMGVEAQYLL